MEFNLKNLAKILLFTVLCGSTTILGQGLAATSGPGALDLSFGGTGKVTTSFGNTADFIRSMALDAEGRIVAAGLSYNGMRSSAVVARYHPNGSLDTTFNVTGKVTLTMANRDVNVIAATVQPNGKITLAGYSTATSLESSPLLVRYNANGTLDTTFNGTGILNQPLAGAVHAIFTSVEVLASGKIICSGGANVNNIDYLGIFRLNANGSFDTSFNGIGYRLTQVGSTSSGGHAHVIQTDGKIVVAGEMIAFPNRDIALVRYNTDGTLDTTFNGTGYVTTSLGPMEDIPSSVKLLSDGRIVVGGTTNRGDHEEFAVLRYNANGSLDTSFNGTGYTTTLVGNSGTTRGQSLAVQADGKIVMGGYVDLLANGHNAFALARYNSNGSLDTSFNNTGTVITSVGSSTDEAYAIAIQPNGRILAAGRTHIQDLDSDFALIRYLVAPAQPSFDYDGDGKTDISIFRPSNGEWYLLKSQAGLYGVGFGATGDRIAPAEFDGDGKTDVAVYRPSNGVWYVLNSGNSTVSYHVFGASEDLPTPADYDGDGKADLSVFRPSSGTWFRLNSSNNSFFAYQFGANGDRPALGDFDGDGKADISIYRPTDGTWYRVNSGNGTLFGTQFGSPGDLHVPADYDGDGKTEVSVFRPSNGVWYRLNSGNGAFVGQQFGLNGDIPAPGDFEGDGKADVCVFRPSDGNWYRLNSSNNAFVAQPFGANGDLPTPAAFR